MDENGDDWAWNEIEISRTHPPLECCMHAVVDDARMLNVYINWFHLRFLVSLLLSADEPSFLVIVVEPSKNGKNVFCNTTNSNYSRETPKTASEHSKRSAEDWKGGKLITFAVLCWCCMLCFVWKSLRRRRRQPESESENEIIIFRHIQRKSCKIIIYHVLLTRHTGAEWKFSRWKISISLDMAKIRKCAGFIFFFGNFIPIFDLCCEISAGTFVAPLTQLLTATQHSRNENVTNFSSTIIKTFWPLRTFVECINLISFRRPSRPTRRKITI